MTTQPAAAARGACSRDTAAPAENRREVALREIELAELAAPARRGRGSCTCLPSERSLASGIQLAHRKFALLEHAEHRLADEPGGADHGDGEIACPWDVARLRGALPFSARRVMSGVPERTSAFCARWRR